MHLDAKLVGTPVAELDTPVLCLELDAFQRNVEYMMNVCRQQKISWRPHAKCHKSSWIGQQLVAAGAIGLTCAKLSEAEVFAAAGITDLLIANLIVGSQKLSRLAKLTEVARPIVCVDHVRHIELLENAMASAGRTVRILIEVEIGMKRVGAEPQCVPELARRIADSSHLEFAGLMAYEGHLLTIDDLATKETAIRRAMGIAVECRDQLQEQGIACDILSGGGTGSFPITSRIDGITELQAGGAIFMDAFYRQHCQIDALEFALTVPATVVGRPAKDRAIIDAGRKTLNSEICLPWIAESKDDRALHVLSLSAEHGTVHVGPNAELQIGDRLTLIPGYADLTVCLHNQIMAVRNGVVDGVLPLEARGHLT
ncbi:MAG: DSD1 family PLP-dependent enzyme [Pirellulaceae bacterium]